jgi:Calx-beta domain-containing protein/WD40 repeat protein
VRHLKQFISFQSSLRREGSQPRHRSLHWVLACCLALALAGLTAAASAAKDDLDLISRASGARGAAANAFAQDPTISGDGRFVAFDSFASNLDPADGDMIDDVFVRDAQTNTTTLVSRASGVNGAKANALSLDPAVSADGRFVAFTSRASNLDPADGDTTVDVYVRDLQTNTTTLVSRASGANGAKASDISAHPAISADGRFVAFQSFAGNLDPADGDGNFQDNVYVRDLQTNTTTLVSRPSGLGTGAAGALNTIRPAISGDGRFVAFTSPSTNLDPADTDRILDVFVRDLQTNTTTLASRASGADGAKANGFTPAISADGRYVAFQAFSTNLDPTGSNGLGDIFMRDLQANTTTLASRAAGSAGAPGNALSQDPAISGDGRFVAFDSIATNLHPDDTDDDLDVFRRDVLGTADQQAAAISIDDASLAEGDSGQTALRFTVSLAAAQSAPVSVDFSTEDDTATAPGDYTAGSGTVTFAPGETVKTITVQVNGDIEKEGDETFTVNLTNAGNARIVDPQAIGTILDDDQPVIQPPAQITINDTSLAEGDTGQTAFQFVVTLDRAQSGKVNVDYSTADGTATTPGDYAAASDTLTFSAGETAKTIPVQVNGDTAVEPNETFTVNLTNAAGNAAIADAQAVGTVLNDDQPVIEQPSRITINDISLAEGDSGQTAFGFTISLDRAQSAPVTVDYATGDGTASASSDYIAASGTVTFAPGETAKTVTVQANGDTTAEPDEMFTVDLANAAGNATIADPQAIGTILNDDQVVIELPGRISINDVSQAEGNASQTAFPFTISLDQAESAPVTVDFSTADGTATAPSDYVAGSGTVTFAPGETAKTVRVQVNGDTIKEANESFSVNLTNVAGNATIADGHAVGTIVNDDRKRRWHKFALGKAWLNHKAGTARLAVTVPRPGRLAISGDGVAPARAVVARSVGITGMVQLLIKANGPKERRLNRTGMVSVRPTVTYTPIGGSPSRRSRNVRLEKR